MLRILRRSRVFLNKGNSSRSLEGFANVANVASQRIATLPLELNDSCEVTRIPKQKLQRTHV